MAPYYLLSLVITHNTAPLFTGVDIIMMIINWAVRHRIEVSAPFLSFFVSRLSRYASSSNVISSCVNISVAKWLGHRDLQSAT